MTYIDIKENMEININMAKLVKINDNEVRDFYKEFYELKPDKLTKSKEKKEKKDIIDRLEKSSLNMDVIAEEDDTSIYEYDYDCIKKSGFLDRIKKGTAQ